MNARNLEALFDPGRQVVSYQTADDLIEALRRYAADEEARGEVAAAGRQRTLRERMYSQRISELAAMLESRLR